MKTTAILKSAVIAAVCLISWPSTKAGDLTRCDRVFEEVRAAVEKEPQKILIIVEDAMVANETCACEIVKGAIVGSNANADLKRQVVLAAVHIAPNMAPLILECAGAASIEGGKGVVETVKADLGIEPDGVQPRGTGDDDYHLMPDDIRGVYLIQPASGGTATRSFTKKSTDPSSSRSGGSAGKRPRPRHSVSQSPSIALGP